MNSKGLFNNHPGMVYPFEGRFDKPRDTGVTMVMDKGLGLESTRELLQTAAPYIDFIKFGFGTAALYPLELLQEKLSLIRSYGVKVYPGGTFLEIAHMQGKINQYLDYTEEAGFDCIEVSDGTVPMNSAQRQSIICSARERGFLVVSEVGKKDPRDEVQNQVLLQQIQRDLQAGSTFVIVEGRETGQGIGMYDNKGEIKKQILDELLRGIGNPQQVIWEAPLKKQQVELIFLLGPNVNLGNIAPGEVIALEALRRGLRGDTLRFTVK